MNEATPDERLCEMIESLDEIARELRHLRAVIEKQNHGERLARSINAAAQAVRKVR